MMALMTAAMMVAMMLPSIAPTLWRYHRHLRSMRVPSAGRRTTILAAGYAGVWTLVSLALYALAVEVSPMGMPSMGPSFAPLTVGVVVLCVGGVQSSRWKESHLLRCRECVETQFVESTGVTAWTGVRLGIDCCSSCAAPMAILFVAGLMNTPMMLMVTGVIAAERVAPDGSRIARLTGGVALIAGALICARAIATMTFGAA